MSPDVVAASKVRLSSPVLAMRRGVAVVSVILTMLNVAFAMLYLVWWQVNDWAAARSEAGHGFNQTMLLPHGELLWIVTNATLAFLVLLDTVWITLAIAAARAR